MSPRTFKDMFEDARRDPEYHKELAILEFTEELTRVMQEQGVTRTELGRRIGSSQAYISRVLNGGANFTLATMTKLAMALDMELKMHIAPARTHTAWRDTPSNEGDTRSDELKRAERLRSSDRTTQRLLAEGYRERAAEALTSAETALLTAAEPLPKR